MRVMVIAKATPEGEAGVMPSQELMAEVGVYVEELVKNGIMVAGEGLHPSSKGKRIRFSGKHPTVIDGPFTETKELIGSFWIWQVASMDDAVEWVKRCPMTDFEVEIRPIFEVEDFADACTPEMREQEAELRTEREKQTA